MNKLKGQHTIARMAKVLGVSRSGYYAWAKRKPSKHTRTDAELTEKIRKIFTEHRRRYGSPRVWETLKSRGVSAGKKRIARLMRENGWVARHRRHFVRTTDSAHGRSVFKNFLERDFQAKYPGQKWVSDITYLRTRCYDVIVGKEWYSGLTGSESRRQVESPREDALWKYLSDPRGQDKSQPVAVKQSEAPVWPPSALRETRRKTSNRSTVCQSPDNCS
jgi:hypothetical protein